MEERRGAAPTERDQPDASGDPHVPAAAARAALHGRVTVDPEVMVGKPVIAGTRLTVELLLERLGSGWTMAELLDDYPQLVEADVRAALRYAAAALREELVLPLPPPGAGGAPPAEGQPAAAG